MKKFTNFIVDKRKYLFVLYVLLVAAGVFGIFATNVNYDMSKYLPDNSTTKTGMNMMSDEFGDMSSITVMLDDLNATECNEVKADLEKLPNVSSVIYYADDENYQKDNHSKFLVNMNVDTYSDEAADTLETIRKQYGDKELSVAGAVVDNDMLISTLLNEIPLIALIAVIIVFTILFILCDSWIEPFLFMMCIGVAIIINMGTNVMLPSVSFMTFAVGALLQLGLSMDYSIMLMNRYSQEKLEDDNPSSAMKKALIKSFGAISGSSVTTIVGLLVLVFMSFKIGQDMGIVLAKGVFISLICIFTLLPGIVVALDKVITKAKKRSLNPKMTRFVQGSIKGRFVILPLVIVVVAVSFVIKSDLSISFIKMFDNEGQEKIESAFGVENQTVLLYENAEEAKKTKEFISWLEQQDEVKSVQDYSNTIGKKYTYQELSTQMNLDTTQAEMIFKMYADSQNTSDYEKVTLYEMVSFASEELSSNPVYQQFMSASQLEVLQNSKKQLDEGKATLDSSEKNLNEQEKALNAQKEQLITVGKYDGEAKKQIEDGLNQLAQARTQLESGKATYTQKMSAEELSAAMSQDVAEIKQLLKLKRMSSINVSEISLTIEDFLKFLTNNIINEPAYSSMLDSEMKVQLETGMQEIEYNKGQMLGKNYNRMIITTNLACEGEITFNFFEKMRSQGKEAFEKQIYFVGDSSMGFEMNEGFADELNFVTLLTIIAILIVVIVTFRSIFSSVVLVAVIQSAVFITTAFTCIQGISVNYIALILVQCILMGATIDYGILFISHYNELRETKDKKESVVLAMNRSIKTILTSSLILIGSCLTVGFLMTQKVIAQTCSIIAIGTICSVIMVICILPIITYSLDRFLIKNRKSGQK